MFRINYVKTEIEGRGGLNLLRELRSLEITGTVPARNARKSSGFPEKNFFLATCRWLAGILKSSIVSSNGRFLLLIDDSRWESMVLSSPVHCSPSRDRFVLSFLARRRFLLFSWTVVHADGTQRILHIPLHCVRSCPTTVDPCHLCECVRTSVNKRVAWD